MDYLDIKVCKIMLHNYINVTECNNFLRNLTRPKKMFVAVASFIIKSGSVFELINGCYSFKCAPINAAKSC